MRRHLLLAALTAGSLLAAAPLSAQQQPSATETGADRTQTVVAFNVQGRLPGEPGLATLNTETMRLLSREPSLAQVQLDSQGAGIVLIRFVFASYDEFEHWYAAEATRGLLARLQREMPGVGYRYEFARYPQADFAHAAGGPRRPR